MSIKFYYIVFVGLLYNLTSLHTEIYKKFEEYKKIMKSFWKKRGLFLRFFLCSHIPSIQPEGSLPIYLVQDRLEFLITD